MQGERSVGLSSVVLTYDVDKRKDRLIDSSSFIYLVARPKERRFAYSSSFRKALEDESADLYHIQGIWQYPSVCTASWARKENKPYVITLRGMLYPQCFEKSAWIKKLSLWLYLKSDLQRAACLHATCMEEMEHLRNMGIYAPVAVIPNPIRTSGLQDNVIASKGTPWEELNTHRCGWWVDNDVDTLAATIREALNTSEAERIAMGERGKHLIQENYSVEMVAGKLKRLYEWILYGGEKPEFVYLK